MEPINGYYDVILDSYSSLKDFLLERRKYYKKYVLGENVEEKESDALLIGNIVDCLLLEPETFDKKFFLSSCASPPTGKMLDFVNSLLEFYDESLSFEEIAKAAYEIAGYKISFNAVLVQFSKTNAEIYFKEKLSLKETNIPVVTLKHISIAEHIISTIKGSPVTADIINQKSNVNISVLTQLEIYGYTVCDHLFKSKLDLVHINHKDKTIQVYDLKVTWNVEDFYTEYYLKRRAYIQAYLYQRALVKYAEENGYEDYEILSLKFIVCDSGNFYSPLIYYTTLEDMDNAYNGFMYNDKKYKGVAQLAEELNWAYENNEFTISKEAFENKGLIKLIE